MLTEPLETQDAIAAAALLAGGVLLGLLANRLIVRRLRRSAALTAWAGEGLVVGAARGVVLVWFAAGGAYAASLAVPLLPSIATIVGKALLVAIVASVTVAGARVAGDAVRLYALRTGIVPASSIFVAVTRLLVWVVGALILLQSLGISITPLLTALGVGGLAVALALQDTLANLFAGIHIIASKKVKPGDFVRLDSGDEGYVEDINWRNTTMRQLPNNLVIVPNARLASAIVTNYNRPERELAVLVPVGVAYGSDLAKVERVTIEVGRAVMRSVSGGVPEFDPFIRYHAFGDSSIDFTAILRGREFTDQYLLKHEFVKLLHDRYRAEGIVIPFPIRTIDWPDRQDVFGGSETARRRESL